MQPFYGFAGLWLGVAFVHKRQYVVQPRLDSDMKPPDAVFGQRAKRILRFAQNAWNCRVHIYGGTRREISADEREYFQKPFGGEVEGASVSEENRLGGRAHFADAPQLRFDLVKRQLSVLQVLE